MVDPADRSNSKEGDGGDRIDGLIRDLEKRIGGTLTIEEREVYRSVSLYGNSDTYPLIIGAPT